MRQFAFPAQYQSHRINIDFSNHIRSDTDFDLSAHGLFAIFRRFEAIAN